MTIACGVWSGFLISIDQARLTKKSAWLLVSFNQTLSCNHSRAMYSLLILADVNPSCHKQDLDF